VKRDRAPGSFGWSLLAAISWFLGTFVPAYVYVFSRPGLEKPGFFAGLLLPLVLVLGIVASVLAVCCTVYLADAIFPVQPDKSSKRFFLAVITLGFLWGLVPTAIFFGSPLSIWYILAGVYTTSLATISAIPFWWVNRSPPKRRAYRPFRVG